MGFGVAVLFVGVCVLGQLGFALAAFEAKDCITTPTGTVLADEFSADLLKWAQEGVEAHNKLRKKHDAPPLVLNPKICNSTQWTANRNAKDAKMRHTGELMRIDYGDGGDKGINCGENLYATGADKLTPASEAVQAWYAEVKDYDYSKPVFAMNTGHFTQVVWKGSKEMCMSYAKAKDGQFRYYVAAQYFPPGNYEGEFTKNVLGSANDDHFKTGIILILILPVHFF